MKLLADLHTHTKNSRFKHGKSTIEEMALEANEIGLVEIGITDHGYSHFFRTTKDKLKEARVIVDEINKWSKTKVLLGVEADIISEDGTLDVDNETLSLLDILIISYHRMTSTNFANFFGFAKKTPEAKKKCTNAFVNAINRYPVTIVAHLDSILTTDLYEIGKACKENGTMVEINNRHTKWTEKQVEELIDSGCMFVVSSDAHTRENIGEVDNALDIIRKYNIPSERVANVEFEEDEKSELDKQYSAYHSVYEQLAKEKRDKELVIDKKNKTEITGKLSTEMEDELRKIAKEQGLEYKEYQHQVVEDGYIKNISEEDIDLIAQAEEYINEQNFEEARNEFEQNNEDTEVVEEDRFSFDDNHPLLKGSFEERFQPFSKSVLGIEESPVNVQPPVQQAPVQQAPVQQVQNQQQFVQQPQIQHDPYQQQFVQQSSAQQVSEQRPSVDMSRRNMIRPEVAPGVERNIYSNAGQEMDDSFAEENIVIEEDLPESEITGSAYEQLTSNSSRMQEFKDIMTGGSDEVTPILPQQNHAARQVLQPDQQQPQNVPQRQVFRKVAPENFMDSITRTNIVNGAKPINVPVQQQSVPKQKAPVSKGNKKGGFISTGGFFGGDEK